MRCGNERPGILVAEDEPEVRSYLELSLQCRGYGVRHAENGDEVLSCLRSAEGGEVSLVLLDIMMPIRNGMDTLREIRRFNEKLPVIVLSAMSSSRTVSEAMESGANAFLPKPVRDQDLIEAIQRTLESRPIPREIASANRYVPQPSQMAGNSRFSKLDPLLRRVAAAEVPVLLYGETGAGKEVLARTLHAASPRADSVFLKVNCAALPSELVESELFGYEKGAFTGAFKSKLGKFDLADGGTIFLDEIGDMDIRLQAKLLHVLQDQEFERLGGSEVIRVNVRVMAATHSDLEKAIRDGRFREDLYYRLNVINLRVPALRERKDEIVPLAKYFLRKFNLPGASIPPLAPDLIDSMLSYHWPGNVRELENFMRRYSVICDPDETAYELRRKMNHVPVDTQTPCGSTAPPVSYAATHTLDEVTEARKKAESEAILAALARTRWNRKQAATLLDIDYKALLYKMKKLGIDRSPAAPVTIFQEPRPDRTRAAAANPISAMKLPVQ